MRRVKHEYLLNSSPSPGDLIVRHARAQSRRSPSSPGVLHRDALHAKLRRRLQAVAAQPRGLRLLRRLPAGASLQRKALPDRLPLGILVALDGVHQERAQTQEGHQLRRPASLLGSRGPLPRRLRHLHAIKAEDRRGAGRALRQGVQGRIRGEQILPVLRVPRPQGSSRPAWSTRISWK